MSNIKSFQILVLPEVFTVGALSGFLAPRAVRERVGGSLGDVKPPKTEIFIKRHVLVCYLRNRFQTLCCASPNIAIR